MGFFKRYKLRLERKRWIIRGMRRYSQLTPVVRRTDALRPESILVFATIRNENVRLAWFLDYYRQLGVDHFLFVDNGSDDGGFEFLTEQSDVSLWTTNASYRKASFGMDWMNALLRRYGHGHWCLTVDPDELLVFPFCDTRPLRALTDWLDASGIRSFSAMLLDLYPKGRLDERCYLRGTDPLAIASWFDPGNYMVSHNQRLGNLWIQGGPRARIFFSDDPFHAPALNKVPLVRWDRSFVYVTSTHALLPRGVNHVYDEWGGEKASGVLLHTKFLDGFSAKAKEELQRREHYDGSREYLAYADRLDGSLDLWCRWSEKYINWRQLEILGLMSKGNWV